MGLCSKHRGLPRMKLTTRGKVVLTLSIVLLLAGILWLDANLWWNGYKPCFGAMAKCLAGGL